MPTFQEIPPAPEEALDRSIQSSVIQAYDLLNGRTLSWRAFPHSRSAFFSTKEPKTIVVPTGDGKEN